MPHARLIEKATGKAPKSKSVPAWQRYLNKAESAGKNLVSGLKAGLESQPEFLGPELMSQATQRVKQALGQQ